MLCVFKNTHDFYCCEKFCSPELVIKRFEQRSHAVDSKGVAEYLRALVVTNSLAEYLPDEASGKPSGLPALVVLSSFYFFCFRVVCTELLLHSLKSCSQFYPQ